MSLFFFSVKDFDTVLLKKYRVKLLNIMHACSLGSAKSSSLWILNSLWKQCFVVVVFTHVVLRIERVVYWSEGHEFESWLPQLHVEVSLSKILNPKLFLMSSWCLAWQPPSSVYECVCEWVNVACIVQRFELSLDWKSAIKMQTIYHLKVSHNYECLIS